MSVLALEKPYPTYALPPLVRNAIIETQKNTQAPLALVATSALTAMSVSSQNQADVCRPGNLCGPVNLYSLILADSGERKTTVDKVFMKAFYLRDEPWRKNTRNWLRITVQKRKYGSKSKKHWSQNCIKKFAPVKIVRQQSQSLKDI